MHRRTTPAARPPALGHRWGRPVRAAPARTHRFRVRGAARADRHAGDAPCRHLRQPRLPPGFWPLHALPDRPAGTPCARADGRLPALGHAGPLGACSRPALPLPGMSPAGAAWRGAGPRSALPGGETSATNLVGYCTSDHRRKHQAPGWQHALAADGTLTVTTPTGLVARTTPPPY